MLKVKYFIQNLVLTFVSLIRIVLKTRSTLTGLSSNAAEAVILGNGPSLNDSLKEHGNFINDRIKFCVGAFANTCFYEELKPEYYIFADQFLWTEKTLERIEKMRDELLSSIASKTTWNLKILVPVEIKRNKLLNELLQKNKSIEVYFYNKTTVSGFKWFMHFCYRKNLGMPRAQNVLVPGLMLALNLGFKKIYLFGADHTWHENLVVDENNDVCLRDVHFYNDKESKLIPLKDPVTGKSTKMHEQFYSLYYTFKNYWVIEEYAKTTGQKIYNASLRTFIDAFERININNL